MPPEGGSPGDPREWLRRARSNLARASQGQVTPDGLLEDACFDAQQAAEKALGHRDGPRVFGYLGHDSKRLSPHDRSCPECCLRDCRPAATTVPGSLAEAGRCYCPDYLPSPLNRKPASAWPIGVS